MFKLPFLNCQEGGFNGVEAIASLLQMPSLPPKFTRLPPIHLPVGVTEDIGISVGVKGKAIGPIQGEIEGRSSWHASDHATASLLDNLVV